MPNYNMPSEKSDHKPRKRILTSKPFCDCISCSCNDCPDVLKMLSITITDDTCHFGSKVVKDKDPEPGESTKPPNPLDVVNPNRSCNCDVVARGIRDHVHMNIGMSERRDEIKRLIAECDERCLQNCHELTDLESENKEENGKNSTNSKTENACKICGQLRK